MHEDISPLALPRFVPLNNGTLATNGPPPTTTGFGSTYDDDQGTSAVKRKSRTTPDLIELSQGGGTGLNAENSSAIATSEQPSTDSEVEQNDDSSAIENSDVRNRIIFYISPA